MDPERMESGPAEQVAILPCPADLVAEAALLRWRWMVEDEDREAVVGREDFVAAFASWAAAHTDSHRCFLARRGSSTIGTAWLATTPRVPTPRSLDRRTGDLQSVYVVPEARGAGVGRRLVDAVIIAARAQGVERLVVHSSGRAITLYAGAGFRTSDRLRQLVLAMPGG